MTVMRVTVVYPKPDRAKEATELMRKLEDYLAAQPGFIEGYVLEEKAERRAIGRVSLWESREALDHAAGQTHTIALRSQLLGHPPVEHREFLFNIISEHRRR